MDTTSLGVGVQELIILSPFETRAWSLPWSCWAHYCWHRPGCWMRPVTLRSESCLGASRRWWLLFARLALCFLSIPMASGTSLTSPPHLPLSTCCLWTCWWYLLPDPSLIGIPGCSLPALKRGTLTALKLMSISSLNASSTHTVRIWWNGAVLICFIFFFWPCSLWASCPPSWEVAGFIVRPYLAAAPSLSHFSFPAWDNLWLSFLFLLVQRPELNTRGGCFIVQ